MRVVNRLPQDPSQEARTYALVVGVGEYPHLKGKHSASRDLSTAAASAVAFAEWVANDYQNPEAPLASIDLVLTPGSYAGTWCDGTVETATLANIQASFDAWFDLADKHPGNVAIFYFAGHGVWYDKAYLLAQDCDPNHRTRRWDGSFSMEATHRGMASCRASYQVFFVEACQTLAELGDAPGIDSPGLIDRSVGPSARDAPIIYASKPREPAHGNAGEVANFTSALLEFLRGAGAELNDDGTLWEIGTSHFVNVREILNHRADVGEVEAQEPYCEISGGRRLASFQQTPKVQTLVRTVPEQLMRQHPLQFSNVETATADQRAPQADETPWRILIPKGRYRFSAGPAKTQAQVFPVFKPRPVVVLT